MMGKSGKKGESGKDGKGKKGPPLHQEIDWLKKEVEGKGGAFFMDENLPPDVGKQFAKHVMDFESAELVRVRDLIEFEVDPLPPDELDDEQLEIELDKLLDLLATRRIAVELQEGVPSRLIYQYIIDHVLDSEIELALGGTHHFIGCGGDCPSCFQLEYCETAREERPELFEK